MFYKWLETNIKCPNCFVELNEIKKYFILLFYNMTTVNRKEIEMSDLEDYETLYKVI